MSETQTQDLDETNQQTESEKTPTPTQDQWVGRVLKVTPRRVRVRVPIESGWKLRRPRRPPPPPPPQRSAQLQQAVEARLMTFDELAKKIGHEPHPDKTFKNPITGKVVTVRKMSTKYKQIQAELSETTNTIAESGKIKLDDFDEGKRQEVEDTINQQLDALKKAATDYKTKHRKDNDKSAAADEFIQSIEDYRTMLKTGLDAILSDPAFDTVKDKINLEQALHAKKCGINFADCKFDVYNDDNATEIDDKFGAGVANSVSKVTYGNGEKRVFKKEKTTESILEQLPIARAVGIDGKSPHNGNRNIASSLVGDLLGASVMPKVCYGLHRNEETGENEIGLMMSLAPGVTPLRTNSNTGMKERRKLWDSNNPPSPTAQVKLQQQLNALDWCDVITGQQDRHGSNYLIDIQGDNVTVTGIDNDVCFGAEQQKASVSKGDYSSRTTPPGLPPLIDKAMYDRLTSADFDRDLAPDLRGLLTQEEVDAAKSRFDQVQQHALGLHPDYVVTDWSSWRSPPPDDFTSKQYLKKCGTGVGASSSGGLFGRDFAAMFEKDGIL